MEITANETTSLNFFNESTSLKFYDVTTYIDFFVVQELSSSLAFSSLSSILLFISTSISLLLYNLTTVLGFNLREYDGSLVIYKILLDFLDVITWGDIF